LAGERTVLQHAEHRAQEREDGEVGSDQHSKASRGAAGVVAQIGRGATLQPEADFNRLLAS
jgi:hypothetical protein